MRPIGDVPQRPIFTGRLEDVAPEFGSGNKTAICVGNKSSYMHIALPSPVPSRVCVIIGRNCDTCDILFIQSARCRFYRAHQAYHPEYELSCAEEMMFIICIQPSGHYLTSQSPISSVQAQRMCYYCHAALTVSNLSQRNNFFPQVVREKYPVVGKSKWMCLDVERDRPRHTSRTSLQYRPL
jgi:hypothetical protein